jgi:phosphoglycolate phosphatase
MNPKSDRLAADLIVFDLDGTLADSLPDLTRAANFACRSLGLPEHPAAAIQGMIGGGERKFAERFLGPENQQYLQEGLSLYLHYYSRHCGDLTRLYPRVRETLERLGHKKLAVLSNKLQRLTEQLLQVLDIAPFFAAIRGGGGPLPLKPAPEPLLALMRNLQAQPERTLMVGDKVADILTGRGAGAHTVAVAYGYGDLPALTAAQPERLISQISSLPDLIL